MILLYNKNVSYCNRQAIDNPPKAYIDYPLPRGLFKNYQKAPLGSLPKPKGLAYAMRVVYQEGVDNGE